MVDPRNNVTKQARAGSIAAIIQLLNENLASIGVRTRAMRDNGVLQLLCEAETVDQLEKSTLVERIRQILESIGPRDIRRVKINSRIVREQQMLWLEEINRDPENQLLWFEEIKLARRNPFSHLVTDWQERQTKPSKPLLLKPSSSPFVRDRRQLQRGLVGGILLSLSLLLVSGAIYQIWRTKQANLTPIPNSTASGTPSLTQNNAKGLVDVSNPTNSSKSNDDPFAIAVRIAEQTASAGKIAETPAQWLEIATHWQQASDFMSRVSPKDSRYKTAQNRRRLYRQNSEAAQREAAKRRS